MRVKMRPSQMEGMRLWHDNPIIRSGQHDPKAEFEAFRAAVNPMDYDETN